MTNVFRAIDVFREEVRLYLPRISSMTDRNTSLHETDPLDTCKFQLGLGSINHIFKDRSSMIIADVQPYDGSALIFLSVSEHC